jgi:Glycosyl-4,4'-diaponeurosporenoate acyltransferase
MSFRRALMFTADAFLTGGLLVWAYRAFGPASVAFALVVVWIPMVGLGTVSHVVAPRLPERFHRLRPFELDGRVYERLGVRVAKRMLRRGPLSVFNPRLHLPRERTPEHIARLEQKMRDAEASHAILLMVTLAPVVNAAVRGWWLAATSTLAFDLIVNGYPVILQRYNRALLQRRFDHAISDSLSR